MTNMSHQAVFLFDMNAFAQHDQANNEILEKSIFHVRIVCLRLLTEFSNESRNFRFGAKFFNHGKFSQEKDKYTLQEVSLETFENLEKKLVDRYVMYASHVKKLAIAGSGSEKLDVKFLPVKVLNIALTEILCDYEWNSPDICSPVRRKSNSYVDDAKKNYVFLFSPCPSNLHEYCGSDKPITSAKLQDLIMPKVLFKKMIVDSSINLIWFDTSKIFNSDFMESNSSKTREIVESALSNLHGAIFPLQLFSYDAAPKIDSNAHASENKQDSVLSLRHFPHGLLFPFSKLFSQYISSNHVSPVSNGWNCALILPSKRSIAVTLVATRLKDSAMTPQISTPNRSHLKQNQRASTKPPPESSSSFAWHTITVEGNVAKRFYGVPDSTYLCQVSGSPGEDSLVFSEMIKRLFCRNQYLALECEGKDGNITLGLLCPLSSHFAHLAIFDLSSTAFVKSVTENVNDSSVLQQFLQENTESSRISFLSQEQTGDSEKHPSSSASCSNSFQMASLEKWFVPTASVSKIDKQVKDNRPVKEYRHLNKFLKMLQHEYCAEKKRKLSDTSPLRRSPRLKRLRTDPGVASNATGSHGGGIKQMCGSALTGESHSLPVTSENDPEKISMHLDNMYKTALMTSGSLFSSAHSIVNVVLCFLKSTQAVSTKADVLTYMKENLLKTSKALTLLYEEKDDKESIGRKKKEYQIQILLNMETEAAFPEESTNTCSQTVVALLRGMLFVVGHDEVTRFLSETIKDNYSQNLRHVLEEIEEELGISVTCSPGSFSSPMGSISPAVRSKSSLSYSSIPSIQSLSSVSSQKDSGSLKRSVLSQSLLSNSFHSRQVMMPAERLRKQVKQKSRESLPARKSPRLNPASKRVSGTDKPMRVCRNLFLDSKSDSESGKASPVACRKNLTPRGHHVLKTSFVPETPSPKQGQSSVRSRQARLRRVSNSPRTAITEVSESPALKQGFATSKRLEKTGSYYEEKRQKKKEAILLSRSANVKEDFKPTKAVENSPGSSTRQSIKRCSKRLFQSKNKDSCENVSHSSSKVVLSTPPRQTLAENHDHNSTQRTPPNFLSCTPVKLKSILKTPTPKKTKPYQPLTPPNYKVPTKYKGISWISPSSVLRQLNLQAASSMSDKSEVRAFSTIGQCSTRERQSPFSCDYESSSNVPLCTNDAAAFTKESDTFDVASVNSPDLFDERSATSYSTPSKESNVSTTPMKRVTFSPDVKEADGGPKRKRSRHRHRHKTVSGSKSVSSRSLTARRKKRHGGSSLNNSRYNLRSSTQSHRPEPTEVAIENLSEEDSIVNSGNLDLEKTDLFNEDLLLEPEIDAIPAKNCSYGTVNDPVVIRLSNPGETTVKESSIAVLLDGQPTADSGNESCSFSIAGETVPVSETLVVEEQSNDRVCLPQMWEFDENVETSGIFNDVVCDSDMEHSNMELQEIENFQFLTDNEWSCDHASSNLERLTDPDLNSDVSEKVFRLGSSENSYYQTLSPNSMDEHTPPKEKMPRKSYTPPTPYSLIHLTTSPVTFVNKKSFHVAQ